MSINSVPIILTRNCNFNCEYCFGEHDKLDMTEETLIDVLEWMQKQADGKIKGRFFGGEPTIKWGLIQKAVEYVNKNNLDIYFTITSNAYHLNEEKIDYLADNNIKMVVSMDGVKEAQNMHRRTAGGKDTFEKVDKNLRYAIEKGVTTSVRLTYTNKTLKYLYENFKYYNFELGVNTQFTPVNDTLEDFTEEELKTYNEEFEKIHNLMRDSIIANNAARFHTYKRSFSFISHNRKTNHFCSAGNKYLAVDYNGDLYPCHRFIYYPEWVIGNIYDGFDEEKRKIFTEYDINERRKACANCEVGFCGGNCYASNYSKTGDIYKSSESLCKLHKDEWARAKRMHEELKGLIQFKKIYGRG